MAQRLVQRSGQAVLIEDTEESLQYWLFVGNVNLPDDQLVATIGQYNPARVHPSQWQDWYGPFQPDQFQNFMNLMMQVDQNAANPMAQLQIVQQAGLQDMGAFFWVKHTFMKYHGKSNTNDPNDPLSHYVWGDIGGAVAQAGFAQHQQNIAATAAADPGLLAPVEGVTLEQYAELAAKQAQGLEQEQFMQLIGQAGMDYPKWERVSQGWMAKMSTDTTGTIASVYGKAFGGAGAGQFGAAGQQAAGAMGAMGGMSGAQAGGGEPMPFEKLCEVQGAQDAWATTGQDVNAMLQQTFGMSALDWSNASMWWMTQMATDPNKMTEYMAKAAQYAEKYKGAAGAANPDGDLKF